MAGVQCWKKDNDIVCSEAPVGTLRANVKCVATLLRTGAEKAGEEDVFHWW